MNIIKILKSGNCCLALLILLTLTPQIAPKAMAQGTVSEMLVKRTANFGIDGLGTSDLWNQTTWTTMLPQNGPYKGTSIKGRNTRVKMMYSETGIYCLFSCEDSLLTASLTEDFAELYKEDVVEVFLWPDQAYPVYFEYELSPLDYELVLIIPNLKGKLRGWAPWNYKDDLKVQHATSITGGEKKSGARIQGWIAEFFIPYKLLNPLLQSKPQPGQKWKGNFYRIDYDKNTTHFSWNPTRGNFHDYERFGTLIFE
ncbi:cellulose/xylan binding protein with CBM9 domain [Dyadobacter jejuensis]|uniref:Cellulose/xylan binding protein with CBM9 domain n=1 Tax=Dyadobacter jejuensis TaxID=1082580 RepID=A0A316ANC9_9BACT|nr:carbohydrate-binding family 9-like protein [Dyadobacter jejuensis]PWJ58819.1 cellulose/xylan binding protein with CBM9 domain [Dyadobacter jejuensis]